MTEFNDRQVTGTFDPAKDTVNDVPEYFMRYLRAALAGPLFSVPKPFETWMIDRVATSGFDLPVSQIVGFSQNLPQYAFVGDRETTTSSTFTDLPHAGPTLTGLPDGTYLVGYGARMIGGDANGGAWMSVSVNGAAAQDNDAALNTNAFAVTSPNFVVKTLSNDGNNTLEAKYRRDGTATADFSVRWMIALKQANA